MKKILFGKNVVVALLLIVILSGWLYRDSFSAYFFQDDWFTLRISQAKSIFDILGFFIPRGDVIYYRPLGMQIPFWLLRSLFGISSLPFHILTMMTHFLNIILVFFLVRLLQKRNMMALIISFLYGTSSVHYIPFFWSSTYPFVLGPTCFLISSILLLLYLKNRIMSYYYLSIIIFILSLLVSEMTIVSPLLFFFYFLILEKEKRSRLLLPYFIFGAIMFFLRVIFFPLSASGYYQLGLGKYLLNNLEGYLLWSFSWPEEMKAQLVNFFTINPQFIKDFGFYFRIFTATLFINLLLFYILPLIVTFKRKKKEAFNVFLFGILWFIIGLLPVIFFPRHAFSYYLPISLLGLLFSSIYLFNELFSVIYSRYKLFAYLLVFILLINWLVISTVTIDFNANVHWAPRRAKISLRLVEQAKKSYHGELNIYVPSSSENNLSLNNQDGLKVVFGNDDIVTIYGNKVDGGAL